MRAIRLVLCFWWSLGVGHLLILPSSLAARPREVTPGYTWNFPRDHGSHEDYRTEWWYYTGHLYTEGKTPFEHSSDLGFQLTFFRQLHKSGEGSSYLAHAALLDVSKKTFSFDSRAAAPELGIAGADPRFLRVWNGDWKAEAFSDLHVLEFGVKGTEVRLYGVPPAPILHGDKGFSRKASCDGCASYYYSLPRIEVKGQVVRQGEAVPVSGIAWMDHEFMTRGMSGEQVGWDWFSLSMKNGSSLMLFMLRGKAPQHTFYSGTFIKDGRGIALGKEDFSVQSMGTWMSPSGATYPSGWKLSIPALMEPITVLPKFANQELSFPSGVVTSYWEGAVESTGKEALGYVELTGYKEPITALAED